MKIRLLDEGDARVLRDLRLAALREAPDSFLSTYEVEAAEPESATAKRLRDVAGAVDSGVLGAFEESELVGMLGLVRESRRKVAHRAFLWGMFVAPQARDRGTGQRLIEAAIERLRAAKVEQVHLEVATTAESARRLYRKMGFAVIGVHVGAMKDGDRYIDEELMCLRLLKRHDRGPNTSSPDPRRRGLEALIGSGWRGRRG
jgi:ribosomal protein S18 acetylase RimI-like enzyme